MKDELTSLLKSFISFESTAESQIQKQECLDWVVTTFLHEEISSLKRGVFEQSPWIYLPNEGAKLLVFAHCDVVPANSDQFSLTLDGDKAFGRGTSDMKGNILPFLMAYRDSVAEDKNQRVSILLTTDEEVAGRTIPHLIEEGIIKESVAYTPDANHKGIVIEHKGVAWAQLTVTGKGGHGAYPWDTTNPNILLAKVLTMLEEKFPPGAHEDWQLTVTPTSISGGGSANNQVPSSATAGLDIRFPGAEFLDADSALEKVRSVLPDYCRLTPKLTASCLQTPEDNSTVQLFKQIAEEVLEQKIPFKREHGGTDARYFSEAGIPAFLYGPEGAGLHGDNEWVSITSLEKHYALYRELLRRL